MKKAIGLAVAVLTLLCSGARAQDAPVVPLASPALAGSWPPTLPGAGARTMFGFSVANNNAAARWVLVYDSSTVPADGATTPIDWILLAGSGSPPSNSVNRFYSVPVRTLTGLVLVCSSTGPFTKTIQTDCAFSVQVN